MAAISHRPIVILFCDIVGSTALTGELELETVRDLIRSWQNIAAKTIEVQGGFVARFMGDGILAYFGYPETLEDDAECAVCAGFRLLLETARVAGARPLRVRVGIASGPVIVDQNVGSGISYEIPVYGTPPNLAARLIEKAPPNSILIDERTRSALDGLFEFKPLGAQRLKGFTETIPVFQVMRSREIRSRFTARREARLGRLIGREAELAALLESAAGPAEAGLRLVLVTGEAGVGKSRLIYEMAEELRSQRRLSFHGDCSAGRREAPFAPLVDAFRRTLLPQLGDVPGDQAGYGAALPVPEDSLNKGVTLLLGLLEHAAGPAREYEGSPILLRQRIHDALRRVLVDACLRHELGALLVIEDVHWIDQSSREFLAELAGTDTALPLVLVMSSRNGSAPDWLSPQVAQKRLRLVRLGPLSASETAALLRGRGDAAKVAPAMLDSIVERSGGNPLFAEESLSSLIEAEERRESVNVPDSVMQIAVSRLDRLNPDARYALSIAAVIGVRFSLSLLAGILAIEQDDVRLILDTKTRDLVHPLDESRNDYVFRHALIQEAVCKSLLPSRRRRMHAQLAKILECQGGVEAFAEALAHHYLQAGAPDQAVESLLSAGNKRLSVYSLDEADQCFRAALDLVEQPSSTVQARLAEIVAGRMRIFEFRGAFGDGIATVERLLPLLNEHSASRELCLVLGSYAHALLHGHDYAKAERVALRALSLADAVDAAPISTSLAKLVLMKVVSARAIDSDALREVERLAREIIATAERARDSYLACAARFQLAVHHLTDGRLSHARAIAADLKQQGERFNDPRAQSFAQWLVGWILLNDHQFEAAMVLAEQSLRGAVTDVDRTVGLGLKGALLALTGRAQEALALLLPIHADVIARGDMNQAAAIEPPIGIAMILGGRVFAGIHFISRATRRREAAGSAAMAFYGRLVLGEVYSSLNLAAADSVTRAPFVRLLLRCLQPVARRLALHHLAAAARNKRWCGENAAQVRIRLARAKLPEPRGGPWKGTLLAEAHAIAISSGCEGLACEAAAALATLPTRAETAGRRRTRP